MSQSIEVVVSPQGDTRLETRGFAGTQCRQASRFLEQALGTTRREQMTAEFYQTRTETTRQHQRHGPSQQGSCLR